MKKIDLKRSVYELVSEYPELADVMAGLGFTEIKKKMVLNSVGRMMTIPKGAKMKDIPMDRILAALKENGFEVELSRADRLKDYLKRLGKGESLDSVRKDFVENFSGVSSAEIMQAEQELMAEGTPHQEIKRLCDIHSALFHGQTLNEQIVKVERDVASPDFRERHDGWVEQAHDNLDRATDLRDIDGHPLQTFYAENDALAALLNDDCPLDEKLVKVRGVAIHYAKKGDLLYPLLKTRYDIFGPSQVMWTVDDELRDEMTKLAKAETRDDVWTQRAEAVLQRVGEMIYKEDNILFPLCAANFSDDEWRQLYRDSKDYATCLGVEPKTWNEAENNSQLSIINSQLENEIVLAGGHLTVDQLTAMLNTIPLEISFVDADNINRYFNEGPKVFKRPQMAIDREVFSCHPPKIEPMVRAIISDFRSGKRDQVPVWAEKNGRTMLITYMAVRDKQGQYVGTMEIVQDMEFARKHFEHKA
jgi:hypothetical protein